MLNAWKRVGWGAGVVLTALSATTLAAPPKFEVGQPFPNLVLPALEDGTPRSIEDFRGHKLILHVFASW